MNLGFLFVVALGMIINTINKKPMLSHVETELKIAMWRVGREEMDPWMRRSKTVRRKVCQFVGI